MKNNYRSLLAVGGLLLGAGATATGGTAAAAVRTSTVSSAQRAAVAAWVSANEASFSHLSAVAQKAGSDASVGKAAAVHTDCINMESVITKMQKVRPIPDPPVEALFKTSLANLLKGARDCVAGTTTDGDLNVALLTKASNLWDKGGNQLVTVADDLEKIVEG